MKIWNLSVYFIKIEEKLYVNEDETYLDAISNFQYNM